MFVAAGIAVYIVPLSKDVKLYTNKFGSLATALLYLLAFATPPFIRRAWGRTELHRFLVRGATVRTPGSVVDSLERLCVFARDAVDGLCAIAAVWREEPGHFEVCSPRQSEFTGSHLRLNSEALRQAWVSHTPVAVPAGVVAAGGIDGLEDWMGARSALVVPIAADDWSWGLLIVPMRTDGLFVEENLELLGLMAREKAHLVKMQEMADRYSAMAQLSPFAMAMVSAGGRMLQVNARTGDFFGYAGEELIGGQIARLLPGWDQAAVGGEEAATLMGQRKNGSEFPVSVRRNSLTLEGRAVSMLTVQDISARRKAEQEVEERTAQLVAANKELEAFSYSVSHDLRAPLRAVDGFSQILEQDYAAELSAEARHYLQIVRENTRQMGALIDDLLAFSRLSRQPVQKRVVDMDELVARVVEDAQRFEKARPVRLEVGSLPRCEGDAALLRQALVNLISNAFKFSRKAAEPQVAVGCRENEQGTTEYYVKDNGVGFDMAYAPKLFGVFQRLHRAEDYEGTGVGLAIVHRIISRHGGRIWADAKVGQGATFYFTLN
jgi:PAS domain S-box-containing protein